MVQVCLSPGTATGFRGEIPSIKPQSEVYILIITGSWKKYISNVLENMTIFHVSILLIIWKSESEKIRF